MDKSSQMKTYQQEVALSESAPRSRALPSRACTECKRKKSKCDMRRPECSLCYRIGETCIYPARRAPGRKRLLALQRDGQQSSELNTENPLAGILQRRPSTTNVSLENSFDSQMYDHTALFSNFTSPNEQLPCQSALMDLPGIAEIDFDFDFSADNFEELSKSHATDFMSMCPENEATASTMTTNTDCAGLLTTHTSITSPAMLGTVSTAVDSISTKDQYVLQNSEYTIDIPPRIALELIDEFFTHVHCGLPLLNGMNFRKKYEYLRLTETGKLEGLSLESALLLNGMFTLSARFSKASIFASEPPLHRGHRFCLEATRLFEISCKLLDTTRNSLEYTQGVILLTFNALQSGPTRQAWLLCGICSRLACELGLHDIDADLIAGVIDHTKIAESEWRDREERRRAWWVIWDMDTFANTATFTPFTLNMQQAKVLLPMSDEAWFGSPNIITAHLDANGPTPWAKFSDSSCQSAWAWFLAGTTLLRQAVDMVVSQKLESQDMESLEAHADCFAMALPEVFHLDEDALCLDEDNFEEVNWVVSTLLMLQCTLSLARLRTKTSNSLLENRLRTCGGKSLPQLQSTPDLRSAQEYRRFRKEVTRIVRAWSPRHIIYSSPLVTISLVGPAFVNLLKMEPADFCHGLDTEIIRLALRRLARYWMIAETVLDNLQLLESRSASEPSSKIPVQTIGPPILRMNLVTGTRGSNFWTEK